MTTKYVVFIVSHGRPDKVITHETLRRCGYQGPFYVVLDDLDPTRRQYIEKFGEKVVMFDKRAIAAETDQGDNFNDLRTTTHVRNACFEIAERLGYTHFVVLDDDYTSFRYRFGGDLSYAPKSMKNLDAVLDALVTFYDRSRADSIAISQGGDFIGGPNGTNPYAKAVQVIRKAMNLFVCSTQRPFKFVSRLNEDVNTYVSRGARGHLFMTTNQVCLEQMQTQKTAGGMTETYLQYGTYVKSFYTVMYQPSSCKVAALRGRGSVSRLHHKISWRHTVPKILSESWHKSEA